MPANRFNPEMLTLARESRGLTQTDLARECGVAQSHISRYENGNLLLTQESIQRFARTLGYPEKFFEQSDQVFGLGTSFLFHRKRQTLGAGDMRRLEAEINVARMRIGRLLRGLEHEHVNDFATYTPHEDGTPEDIGQMMRAAWKLPSGPIRNLTHAVESAGGIVVYYPFASKKVDGVSLWVPPTPPLFFLNDTFPTDRTRWTLAHEIGHVVMHRHVSVEIEQEADQFASEFLMPGDAIRDELHNLTLAKAASLKLNWRVSIQALVRRARDLGVIAQARYKSLCVQISRAGMRTREPNPIEPEQPQNLNSILRVHTDEHGYTLEEISALALADPDEFGRLLSPKRPQLKLAT